MQMNDHFSGFHPLVNFLYFTLVIGFSMALSHPLSQGISLLCGLLYALQCEKEKTVRFSLQFCLPMMLLTAFINPAFSHEGATTLCYLPSGNPLTLESILYGISAGLMLAAMLLWFVNFSRVITSDKFVYLFGRIIPALSLILSMTLRFIPKFKAQLKTVADAQRCIGRDISTGSMLSRMKTAVTILSVMITWALENAIETADSMKSRGYGLKGRTAFSIYRFDERDRLMTWWLFFCGFYLLGGLFAKAFGFRYFPSIRWVSLNPLTLSFYFVYLLLCITPTIINQLEERKWNAIHSGM